MGKKYGDNAITYIFVLLRIQLFKSMRNNNSLTCDFSQGIHLQCLIVKDGSLTEVSLMLSYQTQIIYQIV